MTPRQIERDEYRRVVERLEPVRLAGHGEEQVASVHRVHSDAGAKLQVSFEALHSNFTWGAVFGDPLAGRKDESHDFEMVRSDEGA